MMKHDAKGIPKKIFAEALVDVDGYDVHSNILLSSSPVYENVITTYAGTENPGYRGDGGPASSSWLRYPTAVAVDVSNNLYIVDQGNNVIRIDQEVTTWFVVFSDFVGKPLRAVRRCPSHHHLLLPHQ